MTFSFLSLRAARNETLRSAFEAPRGKLANDPLVIVAQDLPVRFRNEGERERRLRRSRPFASTLPRRERRSSVKTAHQG